MFCLCGYAFHKGSSCQFAGKPIALMSIIGKSVNNCCRWPFMSLLGETMSMNHVRPLKIPHIQASVFQKAHNVSRSCICLAEMYSHRYKNKATPDLSIVERLGGSRVAKIRLCLEPAKLFFAKKIRLHGGTPARGRRYRRARAGVPRDTGGRTGKQRTGIQRITGRIRHRGRFRRGNRLPSHNVNYLLKQDYFPGFFVNQHLASISKAVRLSFPNIPQYAFAADLIAPLYIPFVYNILSDASNSGIKRVFFFCQNL